MTTPILRQSGGHPHSHLTSRAQRLFPRNFPAISEWALNIRPFLSQLFLDFPLFYGSLNIVENYMRTAGAYSRFSFSRQSFPPLRAQKRPKSRPLESITYEILFL